MIKHPVTKETLGAAFPFGEPHREKNQTINRFQKTAHDQAGMGKKTHTVFAYLSWWGSLENTNLPHAQQLSDLAHIFMWVSFRFEEDFSSNNFSG